MNVSAACFVMLLSLFSALQFSATEPDPKLDLGSGLDLGRRVKPLRESDRFSVPGYHVWCGAPVKGSDGKYHLFYSRWPEVAGFAPGWALHSEIAYACSDSPSGPYKHVNVALPPRGINPKTGNKYWDADVTHNPNILYHQGKYYLFYTGQYGDGRSYPVHRNHQRIGVAIADHPAGPWTRQDAPIIDVAKDKSAFDSLCVTNPAACIRPDGRVLLVYKAVQIVEGKEMGGNVRFGAAIADRPDGNYVKQGGKVFEASEAGRHWMVAEDPFIWFSSKHGNKYFAIARDVVGSFTGSKGGICMFESPDGLDWKPATYPKVLGRQFSYADGSLSEQQIERPSLLFEGDEPTYLFGATDGYRKDKPSSNVHFELSKVTD